MITKEELLSKQIGTISLGCDKNRVDTEHFLATLKQAGFLFCEKAEDAEIIIVNTCAFIESARKESIQVILEMIQQKVINCEKLIVTGCLVQKYLEEIKENFPEVDAFIAISDYNKITKIIYELYNLEFPENAIESKENEKLAKNYCFNRITTTPSHYAYLKIADGCNNLCSYCTIPSIRGRFISTSIEELINEANELVSKHGAKEIILVAQDVTRYGEDLYEKNMLIELIHKLCEIKDLEQLRLLYCYPEKVTDELIAEIGSNPKLCKYIDIPLQHVSTPVLKRMHRRSTYESIISLINKFKTSSIFIAIRTTFMVGFPGETYKDFKELLKFVKEFKLSNIGVFTYSRENDTPSASFKKQIPNFIKKLRYKRLMRILEKIAIANNRYFTGQTLKVVCEGTTVNGYYGRNEYQAPDIDGVVYFTSNKQISIGQMCDVMVTDALKYDLKGETII
ncbi:MAG: 30S ribosomal protein S12 methylthiotransferase RimO [Clostridia bacterium]|jgi:ribosomal protein S12 methylthiotransferase